MPDNDSTIERLIGDLQSQPLAADLLVSLIAQQVYQNQRSNIMRDASHGIQVRWLIGGSTVTADSAGVGRDVIGTSQFDTINQIGGSAAVNANNPRQIDVTVGGGFGDCLFNYLVSGCFATQTNFAFTEGMTFVTASGCTIKGFSTVKGAATQAAVDFPSTTAVIAICSGSYVEDQITVASPQQWLGTSRTAVKIGNKASANDTVTMGTISGHAVGLYLKLLNLIGTTTGGGLNQTGGSGVVADDCQFDSNGTTAARAAVRGTGSAQYNNCSFLTGFGSAVVGNDVRTQAVNCFSQAAYGFQLSEDSLMVGNWFSVATVAIQTDAVASDVQIVGNHFLNCTTGIKCLTALTDHLLIADNHFNIGTTGIDLTVIDNSASIENVITNNHFNGTTAPIKWPTDANAAMSGWCSGNRASGSFSMFVGTKPLAMRAYDNWENTVPAAGDEFETNALKGIIAATSPVTLTITWAKFYVLFGATLVTVNAGTFLYGAGAATYYVSVNSSGVVTANGGSFPANEYPLATVVVAGGKITSITAADSVLNMPTASGAPAVTTEHHTPLGVVDGTIADTATPYVLAGPMAQAGTITGVQAVAAENKTCGATSGVYDVHKVVAANVNTDGQGTTIFTTQANRPTISNGNKKSTTTAPDVTAFAVGDYFALYTDIVGTSLATVTLSMTVTYP